MERKTKVEESRVKHQPLPKPQGYSNCERNFSTTPHPRPYQQGTKPEAVLNSLGIQA
jgi:hypothetical protein